MCAREVKKKAKGKKGRRGFNLGERKKKEKKIDANRKDTV